MPKAARDSGDADLHTLFEKFNGQLVSPGGAAALLGLSRKTVYTLGKRGRLRVFQGPEVRHPKALSEVGLHPDRGRGTVRRGGRPAVSQGQLEALEAAIAQMLSEQTVILVTLVAD